MLCWSTYIISFLIWSQELAADGGAQEAARQAVSRDQQQAARHIRQACQPQQHIQHHTYRLSYAAGAHRPTDEDF